MIFYRKIFVILIIFSLISCGKNKENEEHELEQQKEPHFEQNTNPTPELQKNDITFESPEDSVKAVKRSILRKQNFEKKEQTKKSEDNPAVKKAKAPSFVYIKKILNECEIGKTMTQEDLQSQVNIPKEAIQLVKTVTKIPDNKLDVKWKTT